jgi:hypothetical protein
LERLEVREDSEAEGQLHVVQVEGRLCGIYSGG